MGNDCWWYLDSVVWYLVWLIGFWNGRNFLDCFVGYWYCWVVCVIGVGGDVILWFYFDNVYIWVNFV